MTIGLDGSRLRIRRQRLRERSRQAPLSEPRIGRFAVRHELRADLRQRPACSGRLRPRLDDGHDAVDLQPDTFSREPLHKARLLTGLPDLPACPLILSLGGSERHCCSNEQQAERSD